MTYLITGATGNVGARVVDLLIARGEQPAILVRDVTKARQRFGDRVTIVRGDLSDAASLASAFRDAERVLLINSGPDLGRRDEIAAHAARAAGVSRLVKLSTIDVEHHVGTGPWHARGEAAIRSSGMDFTLVRPAGFMDNALLWAPAIKSRGVVESPTGNGEIAFIHCGDIAEVTTVALTAPRHQYDGQALSITGPTALSTAQMVAKIGTAIGKVLAVKQISLVDERHKWMQRGDSAESIDYHLSIFHAIHQGTLAATTDTLARILGRPPMTFDQWVIENADAFRDPTQAPRNGWALEAVGGAADLDA
jgi:uncharacterized protein YbjT (DUF2867 family)